MTEPTMRPLDASELAVVRAERENVDAPADAQQRVLARLAIVAATATAAASAASAAKASAPPASTGAAAAPAAVKAAASVKLVAALLVGGAMGAAGHAAVTKPPPPRIVYVDRATESAPAASPSAEPAAPAESTQAPAPLPSSASSASPATNGGDDGPSNLARERALLDVARNAITQGDPQAALAPLDAHRARFPHGALAEEREALAVKAFVRLGRADEARARADAFRKRYPKSLLLDGVETDVGTLP